MYRLHTFLYWLSGSPISHTSTACSDEECVSPVLGHLLGPSGIECPASSLSVLIDKVPEHQQTDDDDVG